VEAGLTDGRGTGDGDDPLIQGFCIEAEGCGACGLGGRVVPTVALGFSYSGSLWVLDAVGDGWSSLADPPEKKFLSLRNQPLIDQTALIGALRRPGR
jgi:hypothetical protein